MDFNEIINEISKNSYFIDKEASFPKNNLEIFRREGLLGLLVPRIYGGMGCTYKEYQNYIFSIAAECLSTAMILCMHCQQVATIVLYGSEELKGQVLPDVAKGKLYIGSITTDKNKGGALMESESVIVKQEGQPHSLFREAPIVTGGAHCDAFLIKTSERNGGLSLIFLKKEACQVEYKAVDWDPMGMRGTESIGISINAKFTDDAYVGEAGQFDQIVANVFAPVGHYGWACAWYGAAANAYAKYMQFSRKNKAARDNLKEADLKLEKLSRMKMDLDSSFLFIEKMTKLLDSQINLDSFEHQIFVNEIKIFISERCFRVIDQLLELAGLGLGYMKGSPLKIERGFRDLRSASLNFSNDRLMTINGILALAVTPRLAPSWG